MKIEKFPPALREVKSASRPAAGPVSAAKKIRRNALRWSFRASRKFLVFRAPDRAKGHRPLESTTISPIKNTVDSFPVQSKHCPIRFGKNRPNTEKLHLGLIPPIERDANAENNILQMVRYVADVGLLGLTNRIFTNQCDGFGKQRLWAKNCPS